jgi:hypothetical protein
MKARAQARHYLLLLSRRVAGSAPLRFVRTPDPYLFDAEGRLVYRGRIDDNWKEPIEPLRHDLRERSKRRWRAGRGRATPHGLQHQMEPRPESSISSYRFDLDKALTLPRSKRRVMTKTVNPISRYLSARTGGRTLLRRAIPNAQ